MSTIRTDGIDYDIIGDDMQLVEVELDPQEGVRAEAGRPGHVRDGVVDEHNGSAPPPPRDGVF